MVGLEVGGKSDVRLNILDIDFIDCVAADLAPGSHSFFCNCRFLRCTMRGRIGSMTFNTAQRDHLPDVDPSSLGEGHALDLTDADPDHVIAIPRFQVGSILFDPGNCVVIRRPVSHAWALSALPRLPVDAVWDSGFYPAVLGATIVPGEFFHLLFPRGYDNSYEVEWLAVHGLLL